MSQEDLKFEFTQTSKTGSGVLKAKINGDPAFLTLKCDPTMLQTRQQILAEVQRKRPRLDLDKVEEALDFVAAECVGPVDEKDQEKVSQGQRVTQLAGDADLFHADGIAYATVTVPNGDSGTHPETCPVYSDDFKRWLGSRYHRNFRVPATATAIQDAVNVLAGIAIYERPEKKVAVRLAEHDGAIYLDLCNDAWEVAEVTPAGWKLITDPPVRFLRKRGMLPLPKPARGGKVSELRPLLNCRDDKQWILMVSWLVGSLNPGGPYAVLYVNGEHGSAKSTTSKMLRMLIDPNKALLRSPPRDVRDLYIQANNSWVCALDNLSSIPQWLSDALCSIATGGSFSTRQLTKDDSEVTFDTKRPIILNGIEEDSDKHDLVDRSIQANLAAIKRGERKSEKKLWAAFEQVAPRVLGGLLDAVCCAMANVATTEIEDLPRMADFATWVTAAEHRLPWKPGEFMEAYHSNRGDANRLALEESPIGPCIETLMKRCPEGWRGTMAELLEAITPLTDDQTRRTKEWPNTVAKLTAKLRRLQPVLRQQGIEVAAAERSGGRRGLVITRSDAADPESCRKTVTTVTASQDEEIDLPFS